MLRLSPSVRSAPVPVLRTDEESSASGSSLLINDSEIATTSVDFIFYGKPLMSEAEIKCCAKKLLFSNYVTI